MCLMVCASPVCVGGARSMIRAFEKKVGLIENEAGFGDTRGARSLRKQAFGGGAESVR